MLVVIATVLAMVVPSLRGFCQGRETADAAARLLALANYARAQAAAEARPFRLCFDVQSNSCFLTAQRAGSFQPVDGQMGRPLVFPAGAAVRVLDPQGGQSSSGCVEFSPDGRTQPAAFEIIGQSGDVCRVVCDSPTERFRIETTTEANAR